MIRNRFMGSVCELNLVDADVEQLLAEMNWCCWRRFLQLVVTDLSAEMKKREESVVYCKLCSAGLWSLYTSRWILDENGAAGSDGLSMELREGVSQLPEIRRMGCFGSEYSIEMMSVVGDFHGCSTNGSILSRNCNVIGLLV